MFQALLRNPLADPFILGVSSGGAFGAVLAIMFGLSFNLGIPLMSFAGAMLTIYLVLVMGKRRMGMESSTILLAGVIINAFFTAMRSRHRSGSAPFPQWDLSENSLRPPHRPGKS